MVGPLHAAEDIALQGYVKCYEMLQNAAKHTQRDDAKHQLRKDTRIKPRERNKQKEKLE